MRDTYTHGHHDSVLRSHRWRTAKNSAGYLIAHLRPEMELLDVGCGPGTITADLAELLPNGRVVGIDSSGAVIAEATKAHSGPENLTFLVGDLYHLQFDDDSFDVVHAHQVLQHLSDPVAALSEMRRVLRPTGLLAVRECDFAAMTWSPGDPRLDRWMEIYHEVTGKNGAEADAGRHLVAWTRCAGLSNISVSGSMWTFADQETRRWWGELWAERVCASSFAEQAIAYGFSNERELAGIADAFRSWTTSPDGFFGVPNVEVIAAK